MHSDFLAFDKKSLLKSAELTAGTDEDCPRWKTISVWALQTAALKQMPPLSVCMRHDRIDLVQVPRCDNLYLHAQDGVFTLCRIDAFDNGNLVDRRPLDVQIHSYEMHRPYGFETPPVLLHFTLPREEARACLAGLKQESVTAATLYPDYGGVVKTLVDEAEFSTG